MGVNGFKEMKVQTNSQRTFKGVNLVKCTKYEACAATQTQGQGHTSMSWNLPFSFVFATYLLNPLKNFIKRHPNVPLSEVMCRANDSATHSQGRTLRS